MQLLRFLHLLVLQVVLLASIIRNCGRICLWRPWHVHIADVLPVDPWIRLLSGHDTALHGIMSDMVRTEVFAAILILQVQVLDLVFFKKVSPLKALRYKAHFLGLGTLNVRCIQVQIAVILDL